VITLSADPKLAPLAFNGGWVLTHALLPGSPAIGAGNNNETRMYDQRGIGYLRTALNGSADMGAVEFDTIFVGSFQLDIL
jgi:hypothetical protein